MFSPSCLLPQVVLFAAAFSKHAGSRCHCYSFVPGFDAACVLLQVGETVQVDVLRGGRARKTLSVTLAERAPEFME